MTVRITSSENDAADALAGASSPVVVLPVQGEYEDVVRCYEAIFRHSPPDAAVLIVDDATLDRRLIATLEGLSDRIEQRVIVLSLDDHLGSIATANLAFEVTRPHDVIMMKSDVIVGPEWVDRLRAAATSSSTIATASALTNDGSLLSVPGPRAFSSQLPPLMGVEDAAQRVISMSRQLWPTIPTAVGHCVYIRREALDLVGGYDSTFEPGYGEEVDFSQRAVAFGYRHVCADDVFVFHRGVVWPAPPEQTKLQLAHERINEIRYPYYRQWVEQSLTDPSSSLVDALGGARRGLHGLEVGVDAQLLTPEPMGTQRVVLESVRALARRPDVARVHAFVPEMLPSYARQAVNGLDKVELHHINSLEAFPAPIVDVMYRPHQVNTDEELEWLRSVGHRLIVNQLDLIAFHNPSYFADAEEWLAYREVARRVGEVADGVAFLSRHTEQDARAERIVSARAATRVVYCGTGHGTDRVEPRAPTSRRSLEEGFILCLGTSYAHKNRPFAIEVWKDLRRRGWTGQLVLAGPAPPNGTSLAAEALLAIGDDEVAEGVLEFAEMSEHERQWLYQNAGLVLYPTVDEGFGLIPFEAARVGTPTLASRQGALDETLPSDIPTITNWDIGRAADAAWEILKDPAAASLLCQALNQQAEQFTWDRTIDELLQLMADVLARPTLRPTSMWAPKPPGPSFRGMLAKMIDLVATHSAGDSTLERYFPHDSARRRNLSKAIAGLRRRC